MPVAVTVVAGLWFSWGLTRPSPWRDEVASVVAADRSLPDLAGLLRHVDLVHGLYYLLVHPLLVVWPSVTTLRIVSVVAMALTAGLLVMIGRRIATARVGVCAGLVFAVSPLASRYAQEARPFALVTMFATASTLALLVALSRVSPTRASGARRWWLAYGVLLGATIALDVLAALVLLAHLAVVLRHLAGVRSGNARAGSAPAEPESPAATRPFAPVRAWVLTCAAVLAVLAPFLVVVSGQRDQVAWRVGTGGGQLVRTFTAEFGTLRVPATLLVVLALLAITPWGRRISRPALVVGLVWGLGPVLVLWALARTVSAAHALFDPRYLVFTLPGAALALAAGAELLPLPERFRTMPGLRWVTGGLLVPVSLLAIAGAPAQQEIRDPSTGHTEDMRGAVEAMSGRVRAGDAVLYLPGYLSIFGDYFTDTFDALDDVAREPDPGSPTTITTPERATEELAPELLAHDRVWVVTSVAGLEKSARSEPDLAKLSLLRSGYRPGWHGKVPFFEVWLFER